MIPHPGEPEHDVPVGSFACPAEAEDYALAALALGRETSLRREGDAFVILAAAADAETLRREFALYAAERAAFPAGGEAPEPSPFHGGPDQARVPTLLWILGLLAAYHGQREIPGFTDRFANSSRALLERGEWWRPFTALFLHADLGHLSGNLVFGAALFSWVTSCLGPRAGWLAIFASGTLGNLLAAWIQHPADPGYQSLGASTALFGALGILTALSTRHRRREVQASPARPKPKPLSSLGPAVAGLILLAWLGAGERPTDVLAHTLGFAAGCLSGWCAAGRRTAA